MAYPQPTPQQTPWDSGYATAGYPSQFAAQTPQQPTPTTSSSAAAAAAGGYPQSMYPQQQPQYPPPAQTAQTPHQQYNPYGYGGGDAASSSMMMAGQQPATPASSSSAAAAGSMQQQQAMQPGLAMLAPMMSGMSMDQLSMATNVGMQLGQGLLKNEKMSGLISWLNGSRLKYYFAVSNRYVLSKLKIILCPLAHRKWQRETDMDQQNNVYFKPPRDDCNAPDLYIPSMAFITFVLLMGYARAGLHGDFHPELLGVLASFTLVLLLIELAIIKAAFYVLAATSTSPPFIDLIAYSAYKYVGLIIDVSVGMAFGWMAGYVATFIVACSMAVFMIRTLSRSTTAAVDTMGQQAPKKQFVIFVGLLQIVMSFWLVRKAFV